MGKIDLRGVDGMALGPEQQLVAAHLRPVLHGHLARARCLVIAKDAQPPSGPFVEMEQIGLTAQQ